MLCLRRIVLEVGNRTKTHATELARQVDILPDDIRNFLQRWIIVQVFIYIRIIRDLVDTTYPLCIRAASCDVPSPCQTFLIYFHSSILSFCIVSKSAEEEYEITVSGTVDGDFDDNDGIRCDDEPIVQSSNFSGEENENECTGRQEYKVRSTPSTEARHQYYSYSKGNWPSSVPNLLSSWLSGTGSCSSSSSSSSSSSYLADPEARHFGRASDLDPKRVALDRAQALKQSGESESDKINRYTTSVSFQNTLPEKDRANENLSSILWRAVGRQMDKFSDTDMQLAGLI